MAINRTINLLPEIFRTSTNRKFLAATLDQLTQEPNIIRTQGFVGRRVGPGVNPSDHYITEPTAVRTDYQLEPGVVFLDTGTARARDAMTYPGMIDALNLQNGDTQRQDCLFESEYYAWDPFCDFDKFSNYSQYYWLPAGPDSVNVGTTAIPLSDNITVTRSETYYEFEATAGKNPIITLARGGNYTFDVNQVGHKFWIQSTPGVTGRLPATPNISSRDVYGVVNNGEDQGSVEFYVPLATAQDFYYTLNEMAPVDLVTGLKFTQINNIYVSAFLTEFPTGIDGITELNGRTIVFSNRIRDAEQGGWQITSQFDPLTRTMPNQVGAWVSYDVNGEPYDDLPYETQSNIIVSGSPDPLDGYPGSYDTTTFDQVTDITLQSQRYSVWRINYVLDNDGAPFMQLTQLYEVPSLNKFRIKFGDVYNSTQWYKDASGYFQQVPLLTANLSTLYYQDSTNPEIFGEIKLIDPAETYPIDVDEIVGATTYTSPNGVTFTNGLKIQFRGPTVPAQFQDQEYYVEGVGTGPGISARVGFVDGEAYFGKWHIDSLGRKLTGAPGTTDYQQYIFDTVIESIVGMGTGGPDSAPLTTVSQPGAIIGNGIKLVPVATQLTPETYTKSAQIPFDSLEYDVGGYDINLNAPLVPDYITQNRASRDQNAWSRSNRWFHIDVINYSATLNNIEPVINNDYRAKRPIIEFRANLHLWNSGNQAHSPINIIDFQETDALSNINGTIGYGVDGYTFLNGTRVIFAADRDPQVRNRIYEVQFIDPTNSGTLIIDLVPVINGLARYNQTVVCLNGLTRQGQTFWFDSVNWKLAQLKTNVNQAPLFNIYDSNGISLGDNLTYPSSTFNGNKLFGYADGGTSSLDPVLGMSLQFLNINNIGDIVFKNYFYADTFLYVRNKNSIEEKVSIGFVHQYIDRVTFSSLLGWQPAAAETRSRQVFRFTYTGSPLVLDIPVLTNSVYPAIQVFIEGLYIDPLQYSVTVGTSSTTITFAVAPPMDSVIEIQALSNVASPTGFYQIPLNLENNSFNGNSTDFTLGSIRTHYDSIGQNLKNLVGPINGANNTRDLGDIGRYGTNIVQHSAPLVLPGVFLREKQYELFNSLTYNSQEYSKYKALLLDVAGRGDFVNSTPTQVLDSAIQDITLGRTELNPFYWSDMIPASETYTTLTYTYSPISTDVFEVGRIYNFDSSNFQSLLVYVNGNILTKGYEYTVSTESSTIVILTSLSIGDVITIREYNETYGSFVPNTPTKMGLYPAYRPEIFIDESYVVPATVIRGHDGSITVAFGDYRDDVLLEFETRIFNNLKIHSSIPLSENEVIPGQFRTTDFSLADINSVLLPDFLSWVGWNKLDYTSQNYVNNNPFTYNYSQSGDRLDGAPLLGGWRGIYNYFYDTTTPNTTPWEMLGFSEEPTWWQSIYGPGPYTSGNLVLWQDLEIGFVADPDNPRVNPMYARPGLTNVIPSNSEGLLLSPLESVVGNYDATSFRRSWAFGDDGPVESAWRTSSAWPFAVMRLLALTKPAKFFSLFVDRDLYKYDEGLEQYLWDLRYRLMASNLGTLYGNGTSKASYINWIIDYNQQRGINSSTGLSTTLDNLDVRLCWRLAGFSDKRYLKISTERSTPGGANASLVLPDESYQLLLYQDPPFAQLTYSSVIIQVTDTGWAVYGYNNVASYFEILVSKPTGKTIRITDGGSVENVPVEYTTTLARIPYGFVFTNRAAVCDFLLSYGQALTDAGMSFNSAENGHEINWTQMAQEFLYWSNQGWAVNNIINLNPAATQISVTRPGAVVASLQPATLDNMVLNQNRRAIQPSDLVIDRYDNTFEIYSLNSDTINFLNLRFIAYEHMVVLDNRSIFADLIYDPITGARQSRIGVSGWLSGDWNGQVNAPGFILNQDNIKEWVPNQKYTKGDIVLFKDQYWSASTIIKPSVQFEYSLWLKSDYNQIQKGLLPNAANSSEQLSTAYSVYNANLEQEVNLFSYGLIGFRPRQYMQALNLDDVSQVNLYQQFLASKGTRPSLDIFSLANLGKEIAEYNIYEYWSMLRGTYGANANSSYFELLLKENLLTSDPALIQVVLPGETSKADQQVFVKDIWKSSYRITSPTILPTTLETVTDVGLPTAGYVNLDDVDITVFDLTDPINISNVLSNVGIGTTVWVARVNTYDWNVYRAEKASGTITRAENNLNGGTLITFNAAHGLQPGAILIIKYFSDTLDGVYHIRSVESIYTLVIDYEFSGFESFQIGEGLGLTLLTNRVAQPSDVPTLSYSDSLLPGVKVWVDDNSRGLWTVLEKTEPFEIAASLIPETPVAQSLAGASVSQGLWNLTALVGAPGYNPASLASSPGAVYTYVRTDQDAYAQNSILTLDAIDAAGYGNQIDTGSQNWAIIGASASNNNQGYATTVYIRSGSNFFEQRQLLVAPDQNFGPGKFSHSVTISQDENWAYISSPAYNRVHAYTLVNVQTQSVEYRTNGVDTTYDWYLDIVIDYLQPDQLAVVLDNQLLVNGQDYLVTATSISFNEAPTDNKLLIITRRSAIQLDQSTVTNIEPTNVVGTGTGALLTSVNQRGVYQLTVTNGGTGYMVNDLLDIDQDVVATDVVPPAPISVNYVSRAGAVLTVSGSTLGIIAGMTVTGTGFVSGQYVVSVGASSVTMNTDPDSTPSGVLIFGHNAKILVDSVTVDGAIDGYTVTGSGVSTTAIFPLDQWLFTATDIYSFTVRVNDVLYRPHIDYDFNSDSALLANELVFNTAPPAGAAIQVDSNSYFSYVTSLSVSGLPANSEFGHDVTCNTSGSQVMIGSPGTQTSTGSTYIYDRNIQRFIVTDSLQTDYYPAQDMTSPGFVAVTVNGIRLVNTEQNIGGTFTVDTSDMAEQFVTITQPLLVGDVIQIETNQFNLLQTLQSDVASEKSKFGYYVDQCVNNCSLYISSPYDSTVLPNAGKVEFFQNQSRVFGTITSTVANPTLTIGDYIRVNNMFIECTGTTVADLLVDILAANVPNATASQTPDIELLGDGSTKIFDVGNIYSDASAYTTRVYVDDVLQTSGVDYAYNNTNKQITFTTAPFNTAVILVISGRITFTVKNFDAAQNLNKIQILPGTGTLFNELGLTTFAWLQTIVSPVPQTNAEFGLSLFISDNTTALIVGAPNGSLILPTTFDGGTTYFDSGSMNFTDPVIQSGAVYSYDYLPSANPTATNPGQFVFGQQFIADAIQPQDRFGAAMDYTTGVLLIGAPGSELADDSSADYGQVIQFHNPTLAPAWYPVRVQEPAVNTALLNTMYMYDLASGNPKEYFDFFDPLQGRLLGVVRQNLDYIGAVDPAFYNQGLLNNYGSRWAQERVGQIWWDTSRARFIDPHQNDIVYASRQWGQLFPGSDVQIYQWVVSTVAPGDYVGPGTPRSTTSYVIASTLNLQGFLETQYYFWATGIREVNRVAKKTLSIDTLTRYIDSPRSSGISYLAAISPSTIAIYNGLDYISADDTVLHIEYDKVATENAVHVEYQLIAQNRPEAFLTDSLYRKFLDSLTGADTAGHPVPDPFLSPSDQFGVQFRPRQSMFINRFLALQNYLGQANVVMSKYPITESRRLNLLNSFEPEPSAASGKWDKRVANIEELSYQNLNAVDLGYLYLVASDSTNNGLWTIYQVTGGVLVGSRKLSLVQVQNYDTRNYWSYVNWYKLGFNPLTRIVVEVANVASLDKIVVPIGSAVKVTANSQHKWEIYINTIAGWDRVALQDGTIEFSSSLWNYSQGKFGFDSEVFDAQYFDQAPTIETRKILQAINEELFVDDLLLERNQLLVLMFNYIQSEEEAPTWLTKTSLIDVDHVIRDLVPYQIYRRDNQDFVRDYITEVKPYHVQIREFNLKYQGFDQYSGALVDFDVPAYYDTAENMFISPVLDNTGTLSTTSSKSSTDPIWTTFPWNQWYQNYLLDIESVTIIDGGSNYTTPPVVNVVGECQRPAVMTAQINSAGQVVAITVIDTGEGYTTTALLELTGGNGAGARAVASMGNTKIRSMLTVIRYDRYQYQTDVLTWEPNVIYVADTQVRYSNRVWEAIGNVESAEFDPTDWVLIPPSDLSGVNRTMGYYIPTVNQPGLDLALLISGVDYPGVQVQAPGFDQDTGFDVGNYDINAFDNISYGPDGTSSYDPAILDAIYESSFTDPYLGIGPTAINIDGGEFVDTYESHAPEELVPGITYDTLDIRVFTNPGADWEGNGHGFVMSTRNFVVESMPAVLSFDGLLDYPVTMLVYNQTRQTQLNLGVDYTIDWVAQTVTPIGSNVIVNDVVTVNVYSLGGGNQLYSNTYVGPLTENEIVVPVSADLIDSFAIFVNGSVINDYSWTEFGIGYTVVEFDTTWTSNDCITLTALGAAVAGGSTGWSVPITQIITATSNLAYTLTASTSGTNPANAVVTKNGIRAVPPQGIEYIGDGTTVEFMLPEHGGYDLALVADNDVFVYNNNTAQTLGTSYVLNTVELDGTRSITYSTPPADGVKILISVRTRAQYWIQSNQVVLQPGQGLIPSPGDVISVTTWNNTAEQNIITQVFVGPNSQGITIREPYDSTVFDEGALTNDPGSFDYSEGIENQNNRFDTNRIITNPSRLIVTLDGYYLFPGIGWTVDGTNVVISGPTINGAQVVSITSPTENTVPEAIAFSIFQDMRGLQSTYRITASSTTALAQPLLATDDVIYVVDAGNLSEPNLPNGIFGLITINGERIAYRNRDTTLNTVSGLRRGTAGTGAADHPVDTPVYDVGRSNLLQPEYQNHAVEETFVGDGTTVTFNTTNVDVELESTELVEAVYVYVGGILQTGGYTIDNPSPVSVTFDTAPDSGYQITIGVIQAQSWYQPGIYTASNGVALQKTDTPAARFLRGNNTT